MTTKFKILHLEDTPTDAELVERELKKANIQFEKLVVGNKTAFEKALKEFAPDIIISDHTLPSFDSLEAIKIIKRQGIKIPIILVTATVSDEYAVEIMKAGADDYILKDRLHRLPQAVLNAMEKNSAEQQLHQSETFNKGVLSSLSSHIAVIDESGMLIAANKAWNDFGNQNGITSLDRISTGSNYFDVCKRSMDSGDILAGQTLQGIQSVFNKEITTFELEYPCHSLTEQRWFNLSVTKFGDDDSKVVISHQNITQRKIAEQKLQKSESRLKEAQTVANIGSWETDLQTFNVIWSEELHHIFETDPKSFQVTHEAFYDFIHPEDRDKVNTTFENSLNSHTITSVEHRIITTNGRLKHVCERWKILRDEQGHPVRAVGTCQDITARKIIENKLNASSNELETAVADLNKILNSSLDVICTINANGEFVNVSAASQQVWGYTPKELIGSKFMDLVYDADADITSRVAEKIANNIRVPIFENRYVHKSGRIVPILWSVNWDEKLQIMFCIAKDVTEKKRLEKAVERERDQFFEMFSKAPSAIGMLKGANHVFEIVNPLYLQLIGKEDVIGKTVAEVLPEITEQGFIGILDSVYATGKSYIGKEVLIKFDKRGNGELTDAYVNFIYQAYRNKEGNIDGIFFFANDITEQIQSRKAVEKSEKKYRLIVETAQEGIWQLDELNNTTFVNQKMCEILEYTNDGMLGKELYYFMDEEGKQLAEKLIQDRQSGKAGNHDFKFISKSGNEIWTSVSANPIFDEEGKYMGSFAMISDITDRIEAEKTLQVSEEFNRTILESSPDCLKVIDNEGRLQFMNSNGCNLMEVDDFNTLKNKYWWDMWGDENKQIIRASIKKSLEGKAARFEAFSNTQKGNGKWWDVMISPVTKTADGIEQIISVSRDITKKRKVDEENKFQANLLKTIGQAAISTDINGIVNYWNQAAEDIYGWTPEEAIGKNIIHLTPAHTTRDLALEIMEELKKGRSWSGEFKVRKKDGTNFPALVTNSPIYDEDNKLSGIIGISSDITEKKKLEALLEKSNRLARVGSWEIDVDKGTVFWSDITKEIRETEADFIPDLSTGIGSFIEGTNRDIISQRVKHCVDKGIPWDEELQITTFKGNLKWVRTIGEAEFVQGKCTKVYGSFQDITERKTAESERSKMISDIVQRNSDLEQFSYMVSHNLRAPTANIIGFAEILEDETLTPQEKNESLQGLSASVTGLDTIIKDINSILQNNREVHEKKDIVIFSKLVNDIMISIGNLIDKHRVQIISDFSQVDEIYSLKIYIYSIFYNLISNSIKYGKSNEPPLIEIKSKKENGKIFLIFKDNGLGIDLKTKGDKIFGLYNRFHSHVEGKGMGLFMVKTQVESLGGKISIASELNKGTEFTIIFEN